MKNADFDKKEEYKWWQWKKIPKEHNTKKVLAINDNLWIGSANGIVAKRCKKSNAANKRKTLMKIDLFLSYISIRLLSQIGK